MYRQVVEGLQAGIWVLDQTGCTIYVNPHLATMLGYTAAEIRGQPLASFLEQADQQAANGALERCGQNSSSEQDWHFVCKDGSRICASLHLSPLTDPNGHHAGYIGTVQDVTEHRQAMQAFKKSQRLLQGTQQIAEVGGWEMDLDTGRITCTEEVYRIHEVPADHEPCLDHALQYYAPEERAVLQEAMRRGMETGELWDLDLPFTSAAGRHLWVRAKGRVEYRDGRAVKLSGTFQDISEQKEAQTTRALLASIVESSSEAIVSTKLDGTILSWNPGAERTFGYSSEQTLGHCITHVSPPELRGTVQEMLEQVAVGNQIERQEMALARNDDRRIDISVTMSPIRAGGERITGAAIVVRDITALKRAERAMHEANDRLEISVQERTRDLLWVNEELLALAQAEREERQVAELLTRASLALSQTLSLEPLLETLLDYLAELVAYDSAEVLLWQSPTHLAVSVVRGYERWDDGRDFAAITLEAGTNDLVDQVLGGHARALLPDTRAVPGWTHPLDADHVLSWMAVPLTAGEKVIGLCGLGKAEPGFFTPEHVRLAEALSSQAAVAVENAWLFEQVRAGRERLQSLARGLVEVQESERRYVARELHDEAGQALSALMVGLGLLEREAGRPEAVIAGIGELRRIADGVMEDLHRLAMDLRPSSLDRLGLVPALAQHMESAADKHDLAIQFETVGLDGRLPPEAETALYRIAQEALTNVIRHAQATRVDVLLEARGDKLCMIVEDNGVGFDPAAVHNHGRLGLFGIRERVEMLRGRLAVESTPGAGTALLLEIPYERTHSSGR